MINFKKLILQNFLGFGEIPTEFLFERDGTTLICGINGVGKSSLINGLVYTLYGKPMTNSVGKVDDLINFVNQKRMLTTVEFEKDGSLYRVERGRKMKTGAAGNYVQVFKDGEDITSAGAINGNKLVESIINIPYELFIRIVAISSTYTPFLSLPVKSAKGANQTDMIEELFNLTTLTEKSEVLKEQIKETKRSIEHQIVKRDTLEEEREKHTDRVVTAEERLNKWNASKEEELEELNDLLNKFSAIDVDAEQKVFEELESLENELREQSSPRRSVKSVLTKEKETKEKTEHDLKHLSDGNCPYCKQEMADAKSKIKACQKVLKACNQSIEENTELLQEIDDKIEEIDLKINALEGTTSVNSIAELFDSRNKIEKYSERLEKLNNEENPHEEAFDELLEISISDFDNATINELDDLMTHQNMVLKLLTKKDSFIRVNLINRSIPYLNKRLNHYLHQLKLTQVIEFKSDMTATVSQFGRGLDFGNLSNGQKTRVNLAVSFAFRDVLQNLHGHINICLLDELLDQGLDTEGALIAADMLNHKAENEDISIFVIAHKEELQNSFKSKIKVTMEDSFTKINYD